MGSGGNEKLQRRRFIMVGIVPKVPLALTQLLGTIQRDPNRPPPGRLGRSGFCRRGGTCRTNCRVNKSGSTCTNQNGEQTCLEPGDLPGSEATGEKPRCSMGEGIYSPSHF